MLLPEAKLEGSLREHVRVLAGEIGERHLRRPAALRAARDYVFQQLEAQGWSARLEQFPVDSLACENVEAVLEATDEQCDTIVIGAHYDSAIGTPGADDNASAVAALLEIARALRDIRSKTRVRLVAYVNEEPPYSFSPDMGSRIHAAGCRQRNESVKMIALEMLGYYRDTPGSQKYPPLFRYFYPDRGNFIGFVSNLNSRRWLSQVFEAFRSNCTMPCKKSATFSWVPGIGLSDHSSYWHHGYPALMVTDTAFFRNPHYHTALDRPQTLDYDRLSLVTQGLARGITSLLV